MSIREPSAAWTYCWTCRRPCTNPRHLPGELGDVSPLLLKNKLTGDHPTATDRSESFSSSLHQPGDWLIPAKRLVWDQVQLSEGAV